MIELIKKFESADLSEKDFHHKEHLWVTLWYLENYDFLEAVVRIKQGILKLNLTLKVPQDSDRGYHETITLFFIRLVEITRNTFPKESTFEQRCAQLETKFGNFKKTVFDYYSRELIRSQNAREQWVAPDRKPLTK